MSFGLHEPWTISLTRSFLCLLPVVKGRLRLRDGKRPRPHQDADEDQVEAASEEDKED